MDSVNDNRIVRILAVDDEQAILDAYQKILGAEQSLGASVDEAQELAAKLFDNSDTDGANDEPAGSFELSLCHQGDEAVEAVRNALSEGNPFGVVFVDMRMPPGPNGLWTAGQIRQIDPNVQIVIVTGYSDVSPAEIAKTVPPIDKLLYIQKPFHHQELRQFASALGAKWCAEIDLQNYHHHLEELVRVRTEELAKARDVAETANRSKSEFLANMSHEIRTPMNAIMGFSEMLEDENLSADQRKYVNVIHDSSKNLLRLINDILDLSKIESGKMEVEVKECSVKKLLMDIELMLRPTAAAKGLSFKVSQGDVPDIIWTDPSRLRQCLINLINNAIKFTKEGHVSLSILLEEKDGAEYVHFEVADTGTGIEEDMKQKIFESFSQADSSISRKFGGTGLGLTISKQLAHLLGGDLTVKSEIGKGSTFSLRIATNIGVETNPVKTEDLFVDKANPEEELSSNAFSGKVLVAEDIDANWKLIEVMLRRMGLEVVRAIDGNEAVREAIKQSFDLILMDMQMPDMNGYDATRTLRENNITVPIVAITAHAMSGDQEKCLEAGCNDYLAKPVNSKDLSATLSKYLCPQDNDISGLIDSVKSQVDKLAKFCDDGTSQADQSKSKSEQEARKKDDEK